MDSARTVSHHHHPPPPPPPPPSQQQPSSQYPPHAYPSSQQYGQHQPYQYQQTVYQQTSVAPSTTQPVYAPVDNANPHYQQAEQHPPQPHQPGATSGTPYSPAHSQPSHHPPAPHSAPPYYPQGTSLPPIHGRDAQSSQHPPQSSYNPLPPPPPPPPPNHPHSHPSHSHSQQQGVPESGTLPPFRPPSSTQHSPHDSSREHHELAHNSSQSRSGHGTPAAVMQRPQDSLVRQRTPSTPAHSGSYPAGVVSEQSITPSQHMEHQHSQPYAPPPPPTPLTNGMHHAHPQHHHHHQQHQLQHQQPQPPPPPPPPQHHDPHVAYAPTPITDPQTGQYPLHPPQQQVYQQSYGPAPAYATVATPTNVAGGNGKRKPMRAQQACDQCRQRKQKCDEGQPCSFCREQNLNCNYRDPGPAKTDKNTEKVLSTLELLMSHIGDLKDRMVDVESSLRDIKPAKSASPSTGAGAETSDSKIRGKPVVHAQAHTSQPVKPDSWPNHRTGPHNLLMLWPSVQPLFEEVSHKYDSSYVMRAEERGVLRNHGKGEGPDDHESAPHPGPASPARSDDSSDNASTPREGLWGRGYLGNNTSAETPRPVSTDGGLNADGSLDLNAATINSLFDSFMKHMYIMHPFLDRKRTRRIVDTFINHYSPGRAKAFFLNGTVPKAHGGSEGDRPLKRQKVANGPTSTSSTSGSDSTTRSTLQIEHSPQNAIVLLIIALGKVCLHPSPLPGVQENKATVNQTNSQHITSHSHFTSSSPMSVPMMPASVSPSSTPWTQPTPPEHGGVRIESRSRRSSFDTVSLNTSRNLEYIPGLAYFAKAAEILGDHVVGNDISHAQMFLLASLYMGQLARVRESQGWLFLAGKVCHGLIDRHNLYWPKTKRLSMQERMAEVQKILKDKRTRTIVMAAWTCLQLEADILAEMTYLPSPIQQIEAVMLPPHPTTDDDDYQTMEDSVDPTVESAYDTKLHVYYTAQLYLRRRLNNTHKVLYGDELRHQSVKSVRSMMEEQQREIQVWRDNVPPTLRWSDDDPPATDILDARLRAKWYGAFYIIHRPFLDYTLHIMPRVKDSMCTVEEAARDAQGRPRDPADIVLFKAIQSMELDDIWAAARKCVAAALRSTVALDGVPGRLIVTNIHGTAHAQFGNMLVLAATYNVSYLKEGLVRQEDFQPKLERTIKFLRKLSSISPTCAIDCSILERIQQRLFPAAESRQPISNEREPASATTSFSA